MEKLDAKMLALVTRFSHWFQRLTGKDNYFLAKVALCLCLLDNTIRVANLFLPFLSRPTTGPGAVLNFLLALYISFIMMKLDEVEVDGKAIRMSHLLTPLTLPLFRIYFFVVALVVAPSLLLAKNWMEAFAHLYTIGFMIACYFISVIPLPPGKGKIREWIESLNFGWKTADAQS